MPIYINDTPVNPPTDLKAKIADHFALIFFGVLIALAFLYGF